MARAVVIPTARPTFAVDAARERAGAARRLVAELAADMGVEVTGPRDLVMTPEDAAAAAGYAPGDADLAVHVCASFSDAGPAMTLYDAGGAEPGRPVLLWAFREPGPVGERLWLNSLCGANLFAHALTTRAGRGVRLLYGDPDEPGVRAALADALAGILPPAPEQPRRQGERADAADVRRRLDALRGARLGLVGDAPNGFTPCEYDPDLLRDLFGVEIEPITVDAAFDRVSAVGADARDEERADARRSQPSLDDLDEAEVRRAASVTVALRRWAADRNLAAIAVRCWPEFPTSLGVCPCLALSRLADAGTATACERDVYGATTMLLAEALTGGDPTSPASTYLVDTVDLDGARGVVRFWHCGSAATRLAADPAAATQSVHCNRRIGVTGDFPLRPGPVTIVRLAEDPGHPGRLRLLLASGESLPVANRFQGNTAEVRLDSDADTFVRGLVTGGFPHHTVLVWDAEGTGAEGTREEGRAAGAYGLRPRLRTAADLLGIPVVEW